MSVMPKHTTVRLNPALQRKAKAYATANNLTFTAVMERALVAYLARPTAERARRRVVIPSSGTGGALPGVDLDSNAKLLDIMDGIR
jgi:hypothetical protein